MSKQNKRLERLCRKPPPRDFRWDELVSTLESLGFELVEDTGSSHNYFVINIEGNERRINASRPHPNGIMLIYAIKQIVAKLEELGLI